MARHDRIPQDRTRKNAPKAPPFHPHSEATRLLCAGAYFDAGFRDSAITELIEQPGRVVPPSLGYDAATVVPHCLRARSMDVTTAALTLVVLLSAGLMILLGTLNQSYESFYFFVDIFSAPTAVMPMFTAEQEENIAQVVAYSLGLCMYVSLASFSRSTPPKDITAPVSSIKRIFRLLLGLFGLFNAALWLLLPVAAWVSNSGERAVVAALFLPVLLIPIGVWHQIRINQTLRQELTRNAFAEEGTKPVDSRLQERYKERLAEISKQQTSDLILYNEDRPFLGAGIPHRAWSITLELERRPDSPEHSAPLDSRRVLAMIIPQLNRLTDASSSNSRDRLKSLELKHCVFLPASFPENVDHIDFLYDRHRIGTHLTEAIGEGGEQRRHFLRIRVGGWGEKLILTVFVRVHTQGGILSLEVFPHVLPPLRSIFHEADALTEESTRIRMDYLVNAPGVTLRALFSGWSAFTSRQREGRRNSDAGIYQSPQRSIREIASTKKCSGFQEMDINRYVQAIQDRIASGAEQALEEAGYRTKEFQQQIVHIAAGGVFVGGSMTGAIATGENANAVTEEEPNSFTDLITTLF
ncbi:hypothetical protein ACFVWN_11115 [Nocardiopsis flavescens]|uniref:hypothetical protein n=1 Tax=Nocardiopsis flavescens TaxID=758803 RepID=UPI00365C0C5C